MPSKVCCREPIAADAAIRVVGAWPTRWSKTTIFRRSIARPAEPTRCKKSQSIWAKPLPNRNRWSPWCVAAARATNARIRTFTTEPSCAVEAALYGGETGCAYGCLGNGDCVAACQFGAIVVNPETGLPEVDETKCTACGACVKACPRNIIELRKKGVKGRRIYVGCVNRDKGAVSRKVCAVSCIGCGKCVRTCPFEAITLENNLAYIDAEKCRLCRKCVAECPTGGIREINFPPRKTAADNPTTQA